MTKTELKNELKKLNVSFKSKDSHAVLQGLYDAAVAQTVSKPNKRVSSKDLIRDLYAANPGASFTLEELMEHVGQFTKVKPNTVETAITDLKNPKWSRGPVVVITKNSDNKFAVAQ